jgi:hypothetical protein
VGFPYLWHGYEVDEPKGNYYPLSYFTDKGGIYMAGYKVDELYRKCAGYRVRIDVYLTAHGYEVTTTFIDNPNIRPFVKFTDRSKDMAIALALEQLGRINNRLLLG